MRKGSTHTAAKSLYKALAGHVVDVFHEDVADVQLHLPGFLLLWLATCSLTPNDHMSAQNATPTRETFAEALPMPRPSGK